MSFQGKLLQVIGGLTVIITLASLGYNYELIRNVMAGGMMIMITALIMIEILEN